MKPLLLGFLIALFASLAYGEEFLQVPIMSGGEVLKRTTSQLEQLLPMNHATVLAFYKDAFKDDRDINYKDRGNVTYIEELGSKPWHTIIVSPIDRHQTKVTITGDHWLWTLKNVVFPFVGIFVVLLVLYVATSISGAIFSRAGKTR